MFLKIYTVYKADTTVASVTNYFPFLAIQSAPPGFRHLYTDVRFY